MRTSGAGRGYSVTLARADWDVGPLEQEMLKEMVAGIASAATEASQGIIEPATVAAWKQDRLALLPLGSAEITISYSGVVIGTTLFIGGSLQVFGFASGAALLIATLLSLLTSRSHPPSELISVSKRTRGLCQVIFILPIISSFHDC